MENESMKNCNYKCVLTGSKDFVIHHKYGFANIVNETIEEYNIEIKDYKNYTQEELEDILEKFQIVHSRYPLGVCIRKDIRPVLQYQYIDETQSYLYIHSFDNNQRRIHSF